MLTETVVRELHFHLFLIIGDGNTKLIMRLTF